MDNVLCQSDVVFCDLFNEYTNEHIKPSDLIEYDTKKVVPQRYSKLADKLWKIPQLYDFAQPVEDSQRYTKILSMNSDIRMFVVTVSAPQVIQRKIEYLHKEFPWIPSDNVWRVSEKQLLDFDILIDDNPQQLIDFKKHGVLFSAPWNKNFNASFNGMVRCNDWSEVYKEIMRILDAEKAIWDLMN